MELETKMQVDKGWITERLISTIRKRVDNQGEFWDFSDTLPMYLISSLVNTINDVYKQVQADQSLYNNLVTIPEKQFLESIAKSLVEALPQEFVYIDLGPGTERKENIFFDEIKKQRKKIIYVPVDMNQEYLSQATENARQQGIEVYPIQSSFEDLPKVLKEKFRGDYTFVSMFGLTFGNYFSQDILDLLFKINGNNGFAFVTSQLKKYVSFEDLRNIYSGIFTIEFMLKKLELLGVDLNSDIEEVEVTDEVKVWCKIKKVNKELAGLGIKAGDRFLIFQSIRHTEESWREILSGLNHLDFNIGNSFIGGLIKF